MLTKVLEWRSKHPLGYPSRPTQARYKGRTSLKSLEQDFPHIVEMIVPEGGFGKQLDAMYERHIHQGIRAINSTGRRDENGRNYIRWCFAYPKLAEAFASEFKRLCTS